MKKIYIIILSLMCLIFSPLDSYAASGKISVTGSGTAIVGNKVTITVTLSSGTSIGSWQMDLNYDKNYLQLTSSNAEGGGTRMANSSTGTKKKTYTFTFKTLKSGTTKVSVGSYLAYAFDDISEMTLTSSSKSIKIMTQQELEATYSKDNNLKNITVENYELDKAFDKNTLEYTVNVPTGTTSVKIIASPNDSKANVSGAGEITVSEGLNTIPLVVTAENGAEKTYTVYINVEDLNPINVKVNGNDYTLVKNKALLTAPLTFTETTVNISETEIPGFININAGITLVGLKDASGNISLYQYNSGEYSVYKELTLKSYSLVPVKMDKTLDLEKTTITINEEEYEAYKINEKSSLVVISAKNLEDGKTDLYLYDAKNNNAIKYDENIKTVDDDTIKNYSYIIIAFAGALFLMIIIIICLLHSLHKKQQKINKFVLKQEAKLEATRKLNNVVDEVKKITDEEKKNSDKKEEKSLEGLTTVIEKISEEEIKSMGTRTDKTPLSKKELKRKKKLEQQGIKENKPEEIKIEKIEIENKPVVPSLQEDDDEIFDLFAEDKKKKKKK